jgi:hypothetical protein
MEHFEVAPTGRDTLYCYYHSMQLFNGAAFSASCHLAKSRESSKETSMSGWLRTTPATALFA